MFVESEPIENLITSFKWTHHQSEVTSFIAVDHQRVQFQVIFSTLLRTFGCSCIIGLLDEGVNGADLFGRCVASVALALIIILLETSLTNWLLASLTLDWIQREHFAVGACEHGEDYILPRIQIF